MNFVKTYDTFGLYTKLTITNSNGISFTVIPEMGARLNNFVVESKEGLLDIIDGYTSEEQLANEYYSKGSLLAPFPNRIADGLYEFEGRVYNLLINKLDENNAIHGFISNKAFSIVRSEAVLDGYELELEYTSKQEKGYPFLFAVNITYRLSESNKLIVKTKIKNVGQTAQPMGFGWHPYFTTGVKIDELELRLPPVQQLEVDDRLIPTENLFPMLEWMLPKSLIVSTFDTGFKFTAEDKTIQLIDRHKNLEINIICGEGYEYVQVFTPPWRSSIAIEPMTCAANAFNNKLGVKVLQPGECLSSEFEIFAQVVQ